MVTKKYMVKFFLLNIMKYQTTFFFIHIFRVSLNIPHCEYPRPTQCNYPFYYYLYHKSRGLWGSSRWLPVIRFPTFPARREWTWADGRSLNVPPQQREISDGVESPIQYSSLLIQTRLSTRTPLRNTGLSPSSLLFVLIYFLLQRYLFLLPFLSLLAQQRHLLIQGPINMI